MDPQSEAALLTSEQVAEYLGMSVVTVRRYIKERGLPAYRVGKNYRFKQEEVAAWVHAQMHLAIMKNDAPLARQYVKEGL